MSNWFVIKKWHNLSAFCSDTTFLPSHFSKRDIFRKCQIHPSRGLPGKPRKKSRRKRRKCRKLRTNENWQKFLVRNVEEEASVLAHLYKGNSWVFITCIPDILGIRGQSSPYHYCPRAECVPWQQDERSRGMEAGLEDTWKAGRILGTRAR